MDLNEYYQHPVIKNNLLNFFSGCNWFLTGGSHYSRDPKWGKDPAVRVFPITELEVRLGQGPDIFRPLVDRHGVLGVFDIEYYNWDKKTLFLPDKEQEFGVRDKIFRRQLEPIYQIISQTFGEECIIDTTWSGYHLLTNIWKKSSVYELLFELGKSWRDDGTPRCLEKSLVTAYNEKIYDDLKRNSGTDLKDGVVYQQFGRVLEFLSHQIIQQAQEKVSLPVTICDSTEECLSLDLSQYADPVYMRIIRSVFSSWDKHNQIESLSQIVGKPPFLDIVRKYGSYENQDIKQVLHLAQDYERAVEYNQQFSNCIPLAGKKTLALIEQYAQSKLYSFHQEFDKTEHDATDENYKLAKFDHNLSWDTREMMEYPNPTLLQPRNLKRLTEELMSKGWHPKHIGGMLAGRYEAEGKGWDKRYWSKYKPRTRANFWARTYAALALREKGELS